MLSRLKDGEKVVGIKQSRRAILDGKAVALFVAKDADPRITEPVVALGLERDVPMEQVESMGLLGQACDIAVGAAMAVLIKD